MNEDNKSSGWDDGEFGRKLSQIITTVSSKISYTDDKDLRSQFTQAVISELNKENPLFNYIMCHVNHETLFNGKKFEDWGHRHEVCPGTKIGYDIYWFKSGIFNKKGDGGYINWAFDGHVTLINKDKSIVQFGDPKNAIGGVPA